MTTERQWVNGFIEKLEKELRKTSQKGFAKYMLAEEGQSVRGIIIALEDDLKIRRALSVTQNIEFYRYVINFKLQKTIA